MKTRIVLCMLVGGVAGVVFYKARGFFPQHAFLIGLAVSALAYSLLRAFDNLGGARGHRPPRNQKKPHDQ